MTRLLAVAAAMVGIQVLTASTSPIPSGSSHAADSIASPAGPGSAEPNLAVGPDGKVYLSWLEPRDSGYALRFASFDGASWSEARTIRSGRDFFVNWADFPSIEVLGKDHLAAHWLQKTGKSSYAYAVRISQSRDGGRTWSPSVRPHTDTSDGEHGFVALWRENNALGAAWLDGRKFAKTSHAEHSAANEMTVVSTTIDAAGKLGAEVTLDARACDCCQTAGAMTANGPIVAYRDRSTEEIRDIYVVRRVKGKWTAPRAVHNDKWNIAACPVNGPSISANGRRVALAWFTAANDSARVKLAFSNDAGATFGAPMRLDEGAPAGRVDTELLSDGGALVTWVERTGGDTARVLLKRVHRDGRFASPVTIAASSAARASGFPRMVLSGDNAYFAWTVPGKPSHVRVARMKISEIR
jgi:hypothetical protein